MKPLNLPQFFREILACLGCIIQGIGQHPADVCFFKRKLFLNIYFYIKPYVLPAHQAFFCRDHHIHRPIAAVRRHLGKCLMVQQTLDITFPRISGQGQNHLQFVSLAIITAYSAMMLSPTVLLVLPEGGAGVPFVWILWNGFRLFLVNSEEMTLRLDFRFLYLSAAFSAVVAACSCINALRYLKRTNIMDVVREEHRNEPLKQLGRWCGPLGFILVLAGAVMGYRAPYVYMKLFHACSNALLVSTVLIAGGSFAISYLPTLGVRSMLETASRPFDYFYHYRQDQHIPGEKELSAMARKHGTAVKDFREVPYLSLGMDGTTEIADEGNAFHIEYIELLREGKFFSETDYKTLTGEKISVEYAQKPDAGPQRFCEKLCCVPDDVPIYRHHLFPGCYGHRIHPLPYHRPEQPQRFRRPETPGRLPRVPEKGNQKPGRTGLSISLPDGNGPHVFSVFYDSDRK